MHANHHSDQRRSLVSSSTCSDSHQLKRNRNMMSLISSPNCVIRKHKNESSFACDNDSNAHVSALIIGSTNFLVTNKMRNMNVNAISGPLPQLKLCTTSMKYPNKHKFSSISSS